MEMTATIPIGRILWDMASMTAKGIIHSVLLIGCMAVSIIGEIVVGVLRFMLGILIALLSAAVAIGSLIWLLTL